MVVSQAASQASFMMFPQAEWIREMQAAVSQGCSSWVKGEETEY
ncbi:hypothetical protein BN137_4231 [Cronobacter condimenti 1330]|uniref:Uncharacterized protein n=1 Tax=Cronobacter condimenti 1330 TaxID=1073999 RepID=K8AKN3_9ENTR|nr:hypothetical protein BN137_4231 [Cronobacter condimenti 1330]